ncbi:ATP-dependent helicase/nuclease subunit A [Oikeobacillus pervagus]|uniref:ATP-dependent helicase/nuclease subunit A n=1 Tax=Oikeobacillus pervagus TaxID=1325931 RepID=A0AAJ1SYD7_9BACI|nr:helicase-exonuclease AddAB subunit AddA [Oikeobacillus pervagus]MDQ0214784.1 ATP-dependent helicase/nuclease subunit A [Oikeobacillus pervagus]
MEKPLIPKKPEHVTWTDDQWKAIMAKGQDILVAAAAGSGKTAVLVERMIRKILDEEQPIDVDQLLVVTFTNASAAEMRHRIGGALERAIDEDPNSYHLRRQLSLLNHASISTLHSFCLEVIRKYYYMIDIDPAFRIADDTEGLLLRDEVLDDLFEEEYGKEDNQSFYQLVDTFSNDRSDVQLQELVRKLYDFSQANPNPEEWLENLTNMYNVDEQNSIEDLPFMGALQLEIHLQLEAARSLFHQALDLTKIPGGPAPRTETFLDDLTVVEKLLKAEHSWDSLYEEMQHVVFKKLKTVRGDEYDKELTDQSKTFRDAGKNIIKKLQDDYFSRKPQSYLRDMSDMKEIITSLAELVLKFSIKFKEMKKEKGLVDFSDLEHNCLAILTDPFTDGTERIPSEAALYYQRHFKEVLIDEYQDVNLVQEAILQLVKAGGEADGNMFMVGDVKQSIYRFRLAEPNLFLEKYRRFTPDGEGSGLRIDLSRNFRSRGEVLSGTNYLFKQTMGVQVGEIEYNEQAELVKGASYPEDEKYPVEVVLIDQMNDEGKSEIDHEEAEETAFDEEDLEQSQLEARWMAQKIKELIHERKLIYDPKTERYRPIQYRDIVILLRSMSWAAEIMEEFKQSGIPIYANLSTGYFEATEIAIMVSLLKVIDNPYQDIPLASVLRSPIVDCTENELAHIRIHSRKGTFYEAVTAFIFSKPKGKYEALHEKIRQFFERLNDWRTIARQGALSELIWQLYRDTDFYEFVGGMPGGKQRQANLRALHDRAREYEETSFRGLFRFLRFIERMRERGDDLGTARALSEQEDVVRLMTIHSSKGLEFPVVFIAGLAKQFNLKDIRKSFLLDKDFGFATKYINVENRISYSSLPQLALKRKKRLELIAEEMRILYVALTRAKEKLYLIGTLKNAEKKITKWKAALLQKEWLLADFDRSEAVSYIDWIGPALMRHPHSLALNEGEIDLQRMNQELIQHPSCWDVLMISKEDCIGDTNECKEQDEDWLHKVAEGKLIDHVSKRKNEVEERLNWSYSYKEATRLRSKQSVSELKRMYEIRDEESGTDLIRKFQKPLFNRPKFIQEKTLSPAEKGTAMHLIMQHIPLDEQPTIANVTSLMDKLIEKEILKKEQAEAIDVEQIVTFFCTSMGEKVLKANKVFREIPFSMAIQAKEFYPALEDQTETILVQGIIDCLIEVDDKIILLDYKTDGITDRFKGGFDEAKPILEERYKIQINLYAKAIENIWKIKVDEKCLYFFDGAHILQLT